MGVKTLLLSMPVITLHLPPKALQVRQHQRSLLLLFPLGHLKLCKNMHVSHGAHDNSGL